MSADVRTRVVDDLVAEGAELDALVSPLDAAGWRKPTPAARWSIADQIAHLAWTDEVAVTAALDPDAFGETLRAAAERPYDFVDEAAEQGAQAPPAELLARWRASRAALQRCLRDLPDDARIAWFGPPMSAASMATARLMETWAHGLDVADALGRRRAPTARLRHIAHLGVRTRGFAYQVRGLDPPVADIRVELVAPAGEVWAWGPADAAQRVTGPALDFCALVTQRRHRDDLGLTAVGGDADRWLDMAQAFAGPPGPGRGSSAAGRREISTASQPNRGV